MDKWADWLEEIAAAVRFSVLKEESSVAQRVQDGKMVYSHHVGIVTEKGYHDIRVEASEDGVLVT